MAKFYGEIGFAQMTETAPGVWEEKLIKRPYYGDVTRNIRRLENSNSVNDDVTVNNVISIVCDAYANENFHAIRCVDFMGAAWKITSVEVQYPRLILTVGGVYNGEE